MWLRILLKPSSVNLSTTSFSQKIVAWYQQHGRKDLPWQQSTGAVKPYHVWLSEIMLQQTQVVKVKAYFNRFITEIPSLKDLALAEEQKVLALWSGLGYYNRARNLHKTAQICVKQHQGQLPQDLTALMALPGIGRSTAAAIMSLAYKQAEPIMDGNVKRVFARHFLIAGEPNKSATLKAFWQLAEINREFDNPAEYTQGLMDLGAMVCTKNKPQCGLCPIEQSCAAQAKDVIDQYPQKKQKVKQQEVNLFALFSQDKGKIALQLRDEKSIWPKLWFVPLFNDEKALQAVHPKAKQQFSFTHKLTHRILHIHVYVVDEPIKCDHINWINLKELRKYPHPKALNHLLEQHKNLNENHHLH